MNNKFQIKIQYIVLSTDIPNNKTYIMSTNKDQLVLPEFECDTSNINKIETSLVDHLKTLIFVNEMEMIPQLVSFNDECIPNKTDNTVDVVYCFVLSLTPNLNNCYWQEFNYTEPTEYSNLIFKAIRQLL